jgi:hypothetical protein
MAAGDNRIRGENRTIASVIRVVINQTRPNRLQHSCNHSRNLANSVLCVDWDGLQTIHKIVVECEDEEASSACRPSLLLGIWDCRPKNVCRLKKLYDPESDDRKCALYLLSCILQRKWNEVLYEEFGVRCLDRRDWNTRRLSLGTSWLMADLATEQRYTLVTCDILYHNFDCFTYNKCLGQDRISFTKHCNRGEGRI